MAVLALGLFCNAAARGVTDPDVWWHLRSGQLIVQTHTVFHTDPYSFTRFGQPWIDHEWLSQVLMFSLYRLAGWGGLIAGFGAVIAAAFMVVFLRCPGRPYVAGVITLLGAFASAPSWGVRPQMLTMLLASVLLLILERSYQRPKLLWWTPVLMLLWVNLHAGYAVGLALMTLFLVGDGLDVAFGFELGIPARARFRALILAVVVCAVVVPLNPYGAALYAYPFRDASFASHAELYRRVAFAQLSPSQIPADACIIPRDGRFNRAFAQTVASARSSAVIRDDVCGAAFGKAHTDLCDSCHSYPDCDGAALAAGVWDCEVV